MRQTGHMNAGTVPDTTRTPGQPHPRPGYLIATRAIGTAPARLKALRRLHGLEVVGIAELPATRKGTRREYTDAEMQRAAVALLNTEVAPDVVTVAPQTSPGLTRPAGRRARAHRAAAPLTPSGSTEVCTTAQSAVPSDESATVRAIRTPSDDRRRPARDDPRTRQTRPRLNGAESTPRPACPADRIDRE